MLLFFFFSLKARLIAAAQLLGLQPDWLHATDTLYDSFSLHALFQGYSKYAASADWEVSENSSG